MKNVSWVFDRRNPLGTFLWQVYATAFSFARFAPPIERAMEAER